MPPGWSPPKRLVRVGMYGFSRNPMYLAVIVVLLGWATSYASWPLLFLAAVVTVGFHLRVVLGQEPWLRRMSGQQWAMYCDDVPRWLLR